VISHFKISEQAVTPTSTLTVTTIFVLHLENINQNSSTSDNKLLLRSCIIRKHYVERITLGAAFVLQSGPELCHLRIFFPIISFYWLKCFGVPDNVRNTKALAFASTATTPDAQSQTTSVGTEAILLLPVAIKDIILGNKATTITDILRLADDATTGILRLNARKATATVHPACQGLLMRRNNVLVTIFLSETLGGLVTLDTAPISVLFLSDSFRNGR